MTWAENTLGSTLLVKDGASAVEKPTSEVLAGKKYVALYFSAHWCGPCKRFTPMLGAIYDETAKDSNVEVVFISSDGDEEAFEEYFATMPWTTLPYDESKLEEISANFGIAGIPALYIVDIETGKVVDKKARETVTEKRTLKNLYA